MDIPGNIGIGKYKGCSHQSDRLLVLRISVVLTLGCNILLDRQNVVSLQASEERVSVSYKLTLLNKQHI